MKSRLKSVLMWFSRFFWPWKWIDRLMRWLRLESE